MTGITGQEATLLRYLPDFKNKKKANQDYLVPTEKKQARHVWVAVFMVMMSVVLTADLFMSYEDDLLPRICPEFAGRPRSICSTTNRKGYMREFMGSISFLWFGHHMLH